VINKVSVHMLTENWVQTIEDVLLQFNTTAFDSTLLIHGDSRVCSARYVTIHGTLEIERSTPCLDYQYKRGRDRGRELLNILQQSNITYN
jgi:hypothetical protein